MEPLLLTLLQALAALLIIAVVNGFFLMLAVNIVCRFHFGYGDAIKVAFLTALVYVLVNTIAVVLFGVTLGRPEAASNILSLIIACLFSGFLYGKLVKRPSGRPIGTGKGFMAALLQWLFTAIVVCSCGVLFSP